MNSFKGIKKKVDKKKWVKFKFSDLVDNIVEKVTPKKSTLKNYIGLEHLDPGSLKIRRYGETSSLVGDKQKIYKNDFILAKRNAYLKRVAISEFDAIASAHSFVLRAKSENILPEFLSFFLLSELFWQRAIQISVGSLSPTINWKSLANQEFLLPVKKDQKKLVELFQSLNTYIEDEFNIEDSFKTIILSSLKKLFSKIKKKETLINLCVNPPNYGANTPSCDYDNNIRFLRITDIGEFGELNEKKVSARSHDEKFILKYGDFLFARTADTGRSYYYKKNDGICTHAGYLIRFRLDISKILPEYLYYFTQTLEFKKWIKQTTRTGTLGNINAKEFSKLMIPITTTINQKKIITETSNLYQSFVKIKRKIDASKNFQKSLINEIFNDIY
jgi:restriction endonuclease S subunit